MQPTRDDWVAAWHACCRNVQVIGRLPIRFDATTPPNVSYVKLQATMTTRSLSSSPGPSDHDIDVAFVENFPLESDPMAAMYVMARMVYMHELDEAWRESGAATRCPH